MGKRLKLVTGSGYSTIDASPLGQIIHILQVKIAQLKDRDAHNPSDPTLERAYAARQLSALEGFIKDIRNLLSYYERGDQPSGFSLLGFGRSAKALVDSLNGSADFDTPAYAFYKIINNDLKGAIESSLKRAKIQTITPTNIGEFRRLLKASLAANAQERFAEVSKIPGAKLDEYFNLLNDTIDCIDFTQCNENLIANSDRIYEYVKGNFYYQFFEEIDDHRRYLIGEIQITEPMLYEFIFEALELALEAPDDLARLLSFLNPGAFSLDLKNGALATFVPDRVKILIEHTPKPQAPFVYKTTKGDAESAVTQEIDVNTIYRSRLRLVLKQLTTAVSKYYDKYPESQHVKSELAKSTLLVKFVQGEKRLNQRCLDQVASTAKFLDLQSNPREPAERIRSMMDLKQRVNASLASIVELQKRANANQKGTVGDLIAGSQELSEQLMHDSEQGLNISYSQLPLPGLVFQVNEEGEVKVMNVTAELEITENQHSDLLLKQKHFEAKIAELDRQISGELGKWHEEEIARHQALNHALSQQAGDILASAKSLLIDSLEDMPVDIDERLVAIEQKLMSLCQQNEKLEGIQHKMRDLSAEVNKSAKSPDELSALDPSIVQDVDSCYFSTRTDVKQGLEELQALSQGLEEKRQRLIVEQERALAAKELNESLKSSDPTVILKLIETKEARHKELTLFVEQQKVKLATQYEQREHYGQLLKPSDPLLNVGVIPQLEQERQVQIGIIEQQVAQILPVLQRFEPDAEQKLSRVVLENAESAKEAALWFDSFLDTQRASLKITGSLEVNPDVYLELGALEITRAMITETKGEIPFSKLDEELYKLFNPGKWHFFEKGFNDLLVRLNHSNHTAAIWDKHREAKATAENVILATQDFLDLIASRIEAHKVTIKNSLNLKAFDQSQEQFMLFDAKLKALTINYTDSEQAKTDKEQTELNQKALLVEIEALEQSVAKDEQELKDTAASILVLNTIAELLKDNQTLSKSIAELEDFMLKLSTADLLNSHQDDLTAAIAEKRNQLEQQEKSVQALQLEVTNLADSASYQENVDNAKALLTGCKTHLDKLVTKICEIKTKDLIAHLANNEEQHQSISEELSGLEALDAHAKLIRLSQLLPLSDELNISVVELASKKDYLLNDLRLSPNEESEISINAIPNRVQIAQEKAQALQQDINQGIASLLDELSRTFTAIEEKANSFVVNKSEETANANEALLGDVKAQLADFPNDAALKQLKASFEQQKRSKDDPELVKLNSLITSLQALNKRIAENTLANNQLAANAEKRKVIAEKFNSELKTYLQQRAIKYAVKDRLFDTDAVERANFVTSLCNALDSYTLSGDAQSITDCLATKEGPFTGFKLQPIINRMSLAIKELQKAVPEDHEQIRDENEADVGEQHENALRLIQALRNSSPEFAEGIEILYDKIVLINQFSSTLAAEGRADDSQVATNLAVALTKQVDLFLIDNNKLLSDQGEAIKKKELLAEFQTDFICHLHSQNDVLSEYYSWGQIAANIATAVLSVVTLGVFAAVVAGVTKISTGRASLFYQPNGIECIEAVDKVVHEIAAPAA